MGLSFHKWGYFTITIGISGHNCRVIEWNHRPDSPGPTHQSLTHFRASDFTWPWQVTEPSHVEAFETHDLLSLMYCFVYLSILSLSHPKPLSLSHRIPCPDLPWSWPSCPWNSTDRRHRARRSVEELANHRMANVAQWEATRILSSEDEENCRNLRTKTVFQNNWHQLQHD